MGARELHGNPEDRRKYERARIREESSTCRECKKQAECRVVERQIQTEQHEDAGGNRLREIAVAVHHVKDPVTSACVPDDAAEICEQYAADQSRRISAVDYGDKQRRERDPAEKV